MLQAMVDFRLDVCAFALLLVASMLGVRVWLWKRHGASVRPKTWLVLMAMIMIGASYAELATSHERERLNQALDYIPQKDMGKWIASIAWSRAAALGFVAVLAVILIASTIVVAMTKLELANRKAAELEREKLQRDLLAASRQAGMAEIATGVLHNVGNVLNSVNVAASSVNDKLTRSKVSALGRAAAMIRDHRADLAGFLAADEKGKLLPDYLSQLADLMASEQREMQGELAQLVRSIDHIKQIIVAQQNFAKGAKLTETFELPEVLDDAVRMNALSLDRHGVDLIRRYHRCRPVTADRHKVLQVLVNMLSNAKRAVAHVHGPRRITLCLEEVAEMARITVSDTGVGIKPEDLGKLFTHGFTTRTDGHGFGLHFSAIAAQQMKGRLTAASDGPGHGATFTFEIPFTSSEKPACTAS
jgi:signal transduction histidine kinase